MSIYYVLSTKKKKMKKNVVYLEGLRRESHFFFNWLLFQNIAGALGKNDMIRRDDQSLAISALPAVEY